MSTLLWIFLIAILLVAIMVGGFAYYVRQRHKARFDRQHPKGEVRDFTSRPTPRPGTGSPIFRDPPRPARPSGARRLTDDDINTRPYVQPYVVGDDHRDWGGADGPNYRQGSMDVDQNDTDSGGTISGGYDGGSSSGSDSGSSSSGSDGGGGGGGGGE